MFTKLVLCNSVPSFERVGSFVIFLLSKRPSSSVSAASRCGYLQFHHSAARLRGEFCISHNLMKQGAEMDWSGLPEQKIKKCLNKHQKQSSSQHLLPSLFAFQLLLAVARMLLAHVVNKCVSSSTSVRKRAILSSRSWHFMAARRCCHR